MTKPKYIVVGELISHASIFEIDRQDNIKNQVDEINAVRSDYYGVWKLEADGETYSEVMSFKSAKEAWNWYDATFTIRYDVDYADDVKMWELIKYNPEGECWDCQGVYAETWEQAQAMKNFYNRYA